MPADDAQPIELRQLTEGATIYAQGRELLGDLVEVVRARGLHELAPELWPVLLVDENGHGKGLPLNRRAGELYGSDAIAGVALVCQERRSAFSVGDLSGFTEAEAEQLRALIFRRVGRGRG
ncbi:hypothetical protein [Candidatus Nephthysia bennettiae]|uniref:Uncharacterized protein n=1 Tax=Candidatus Nephthysia bennettiae TaxID=3127016 RepID=A0A934JXQ5_9BACT|nr:hypothetical protein [Candidatus Dormibacteraeota bacterium]